jgi:hypothetical protein
VPNQGAVRTGDADRAAVEGPLEIRLYGRPFAVVMRVKGAGLIAVALMLALATPTRAQRSLDDAFRTFWRAADSAQAAAAAESIVKLTPAFDDAFQRLRKGRPYLPDVPKGVVRGSHDMAGRSFAYSLDVPPTYDPNVRYQVRFQLHGGIGRPEPGLRGSGSIGALAGADQIYVLPASWDEVPWWGGAQLESLRTILDKAKLAYNIDENRVVVSGVSDGGTGAYYIAMRDTTPYASFLPLIGHILILANPSIGIREQLFPNNLRNKRVRRQRQPRPAVSDQYGRSLHPASAGREWRSPICRSPTSQ